MIKLIQNFFKKSKNKVLVQVCDKNYLAHAKYLFANAKKHGKWDGDYCLIANDIPPKDLKTFKKAGIKIFHIEKSHTYYSKLNVFNKYFKKWDYVLYMDQDIVIFNNIATEKPPETDTLIADIDGPFQIQQYFGHGWPPERWGAAIADLLPKYPFIQNLGYNAGFFYFNTSLIKSDTLINLNKLKDEIMPINTHSGIGSDQPIINLYFYNHISSDSFCSFWRTPEDRIKKAIHFCHGEAPWKNDTYSNILKKSYKDHYLECLLSFKKVFDCE